MKVRIHYPRQVIVVGLREHARGPAALLRSLFPLDSGWSHDNYEATRGLAAALRRRGLREGQDSYRAYPEGRHEEDAWASRGHVPFRFFFRG